MLNGNSVKGLFCKHRILNEDCQYCNGDWKNLFLGGLEYHLSFTNDMDALNEFDSMKIRSSLLAGRSMETYVDHEFLYLAKHFQKMELYDFPSLYILAERTGRNLLDIIYMQENFIGKCEKRMLHLRFKFIVKTKGQIGGKV